MCCISRNRSASTPEKPKSNKPHTTYTLPDVSLTTGCGHRKWKETKQQLSMLPGPAVPGCSLVSFHILWAILSTSTVSITVQLGHTFTDAADPFKICHAMPEKGHTRPSNPLSDRPCEMRERWHCNANERTNNEQWVSELSESVLTSIFCTRTSSAVTAACPGTCGHYDASESLQL